jgi:hypothetical protein
MDLQFNGANSISVSNKQTHLVIDDNLKELGLSTITKADDIALFTSSEKLVSAKNAKLVIDSPGEYEVGNMSIYGIAARAHTDGPDEHTATIYKILAGEICLVVAGHIYPELSDKQLEAIGMVDVLFIPVGGHGYTLDATGALKLIKDIEPKLVIPTNYDDKGVKYPVPQDSLDDAVKTLAMEPKDRVAKLKLKPADLPETTQLLVLERT